MGWEAGDDGVSGSSPAGRTLQGKGLIAGLPFVASMDKLRNSGYKDLGVNKDPKLWDHCGTNGKQGWGE